MVKYTLTFLASIPQLVLRGTTRPTLTEQKAGYVLTWVDPSPETGT